VTEPFEERAERPSLLLFTGEVRACAPDANTHTLVMTPFPLPAITSVAGVSFRQAELRDVVEGDVLLVQTDDENPHDNQAVKVMTLDGVMLGFIPKALAPRLRGTGADSWPAKVKMVLRGETWGLRIEVHPHGAELSSPRTRLAAAIQRGTSAHAAADSVEAAPAEAVVEPEQQRTVVAPSGRVLGTFLRRDGDRVIAVNDGVEVSFPAQSVTLRS
jgi:hypothetical protein